MISKDTIEMAYCLAIIRLVDSPDDDGTVCQIGDSWFYFGGLTAVQLSAVEYLAEVPYDDIVNEIELALDELQYECPDEYAYYEAYINEHIKSTRSQTCETHLPDRIDATDKLWHQLCAMLPTAPREDYLYWATWNDTEILSVDSDAIDRLADLFDDLYGEGTTVTGYYDPDDDRRNNEVNERTGYYYCSNA